MLGFEESIASIMEEIEHDDSVREKVLPLARDAVRKCSESIKNSHRGDFEKSIQLLKRASDIIEKAEVELSKSDYLSDSRLLRTAYQELAEAANVYSLLKTDSYTPPEEYDVPSREYLNGLADTVGELRRAVLDSLRFDKVELAESYLMKMEDIYECLHAFDFPNALVPNLRRKVDVARSLIERTRGDITTAVRQEKLIKKLDRLDKLDG